eukprot:Rhum_TRINITY_DN24986_c0_g1::Rhum_TRINITY_DN24986_c0_g1_i1::g.180765::m.180765
MPEKRPREEDEESDGASSAVASESDEDIAAELKKTVVIGNLEGRLEIIYSEVLAKKFPGAKGIVVDWKTKTAMVEYESEEQAAAVVGKVNNEPLFGEPLRCGVSSGATTELLFSNLPVRATGEDVANMIRRGGAEAPAPKRRRKSGAAAASEGGAAEDTSGLLHVKHVVGNDGTCKCYCKFSDRSFSDAALKVFDGHTLFGSRITVVEPPPMVLNKGGKDSKGGKGGKKDGGKGDSKGDGKKGFKGDGGKKGGKKDGKSSRKGGPPKAGSGIVIN